MADAIYKITINNIERYSPAYQKTSKWMQIPVNLIDDPILNAVGSHDFRMFFAILSHCSQCRNATITVGERQLNAYRSVRERLANALHRLQEIQLLTFEIIALDKRREEEKREEREERRGDSSGVEKRPALAAPTKANRDKNREAWESFRDAYAKRYGIEPLRNAKVNSCIARFVERIGADSPAVLNFFVQHNDGLYLKTSHSIDLALRDAESLHTQWRRGRPVTMSDVRNFEKEDHYRAQMERIERGEI